MRSVVFTGPLLLALELATFPVTSARAAGPTLLPAFGCTGFVFANGPSTPSNCQLSQSSYLVFNNASFPGADPTGATNSSTAFNNLFAAMCANKQSAIIPSGTYTLTAGMVWNFSTCPFGFKLLGDSHGQTILNFKGSATVGWQWIVSGGTGPSNVIPHVYDELGNMTVSCNSSTICWELGQ